MIRFVLPLVLFSQLAFAYKPFFKAYYVTPGNRVVTDMSMYVRSGDSFTMKLDAPRTYSVEGGISAVVLTSAGYAVSGARVDCSESRNMQKFYEGASATSRAAEAYCNVKVRNPGTYMLSWEVYEYRYTRDYDFSTRKTLERGKSPLFVVQ